MSSRYNMGTRVEPLETPVIIGEYCKTSHSDPHEILITEKLKNKGSNSDQRVRYSNSSPRFPTILLVYFDFLT